MGLANRMLNTFAYRHPKSAWIPVLISGLFLWLLFPLPDSPEHTLTLLGLSPEMDHALGLSHSLRNPELAHASGLNFFHPHYILYGSIASATSFAAKLFGMSAVAPYTVTFLTGLNSCLLLGMVYLWAGFLLRQLRPSSIINADARLKTITVVVSTAAMATLPGVLRSVLEAGPLPLGLFGATVLMIAFSKRSFEGGAKGHGFKRPSGFFSKSSLAIVSVGVLAGLAHPLNLVLSLFLLFGKKERRAVQLGLVALIIGIWLVIVMSLAGATGILSKLGLVDTVLFSLTLNALPPNIEAQIFYPVAGVWEAPLAFDATAARLVEPGLWSGVFLLCVLLCASVLIIFLRDSWRRRHMLPFHSALAIGLGPIILIMGLMTCVFMLTRHQTALYAYLFCLQGLLWVRLLPGLRARSRSVVLAILVTISLITLAWNAVGLFEFRSQYQLQVNSKDTYRADGKDVLPKGPWKHICKSRRPLVLLVETSYLPTVLPVLNVIFELCPGRNVEVRPFPVGFSMPWFEFHPTKNNPPPGGWTHYRESWLDSMEPAMFYPGQAESLARYIEFVYRRTAHQFLADSEYLIKPEYLVFFRHRSAQLFVTHRELQSGEFRFLEDDRSLGLAWLELLQDKGYQLNLVEADELSPAIGRYNSRIDIDAYELINGLEFADCVTNVFYAYLP